MIKLKTNKIFTKRPRKKIKKIRVKLKEKKYDNLKLNN